ncbi:biotin-dependent carboxyltransferase family protein [Actinospica sp.]|uniref:5-oxoprolinase subunit C family protein n=1 Tax=Actinospica sp. TaxID=1872142 RepID=UPI002BE70F03|nr:biotin-dependent carboxyltransferase family protein [Actinospica sp.]HWG22891.1 biotin-dependent carboxyltransferase family protein [Actinospica sp.]
MNGIHVLSPGPLTTVQDLGRPGLASVGVGPSGAADRGSLRLANRLVGNPEDAAALELTYGGLRIRFDAAATIALTGAPCPGVAMNGPVHVAAGQELAVGIPSEGLRTYLAVRGGIDVPEVLGSRSTDVLAGIGPAVLETGMRLPIGSPGKDFPNVDLAPPTGLGPAVLRVLPGPRDDWFVPDALASLTESAYVVTKDSNRVGVRLDGPELKRRVSGELPSEGAVCGALQVPPDGRPILFLADHPVTGGYPVIAVVADADLDRAGQLRAGDGVRFCM